jgi:hypothetical protein
MGIKEVTAVNGGNRCQVSAQPLAVKRGQLDGRKILSFRLWERFLTAMNSV